ncbi:MAG: NADH-quinone oxidoreductase subunit L, partial [Pseudomonadota bacterium]
WRLIYMTFHGPMAEPASHDDHVDDHHEAEPEGDGHDHAHHSGPPHESPLVMLIPLGLLALGAIFSGLLFYDPMFHHGEGFWGEAIYRSASNQVIEGVDKLKYDSAYEWVFWAPVIVTLIGFLLATFTYLFNRGVGQRIADSGGPLHALFSNKWYFDEIYDATIIRGSRFLGDTFWKTGDKRLIDGLGPDGVSALVRWSSRRLSAMHTGYLYHYAFVIIGAALVFGAILYWRTGGAG